MKYRSINLLLPMLVVSFYIGAADEAASPSYKDVTTRSLQKQMIANHTKQFDNTELPEWDKLRNQRRQEWDAHDTAVSEIHEESRQKTIRTSATAKQRIAPLNLREEINNFPATKSRGNRVTWVSDFEDITPKDFDGMTMPALTEVVSQWESEEEEALETFVIFGSEQNKDALIQARPMNAYHVKEVHNSEGCRYKLVSAETFEPGAKESTLAKLDNLNLKKQKLEKNNPYEIPSSASKELAASKVGRKNKLDAPKSPETFALDLRDPKKEPKTCTQRFDDLMKENDKLIAAPSASIIGFEDEDLANHENIIKQLTPELHKMVAALHLQRHHSVQTRNELSNVNKKLDTQTIPNDVVFYIHALKQVTDEKELFTPEELLLVEKTITMKEKFKDSKIVHALNRGQERESTLGLSAIPRRTVRVVVDKEAGQEVREKAAETKDLEVEIIDKRDEQGQPILHARNGTIPIERAVEIAEKTYDSWRLKNWGMPQDASDLLNNAEMIAKNKQKFAETADANEKHKLRVQRKELETEKKQLVKDIKEKILTYIKENPTNYSPALTEQKNNLEALIGSIKNQEGESWAIELATRHIASMLRHLPADERDELLAGNNNLASILRNRMGEMSKLVKNTQDYNIEEPKEEIQKAEPKEKEEVQKAEPTEKEAEVVKKPKKRNKKKKKQAQQTDQTKQQEDQTWFAWFSNSESK